MSTAMKPVKKLNDDKMKADKKEQTDKDKALQQEKSNEQKQHSAARASLKRGLVTNKVFLHGNRDADAAPQIDTLNTEDELKEYADFSKPVAFVSPSAQTILEDQKDDQKAETAGFWMAKWQLRSTHQSSPVTFPLGERVGEHAISQSDEQTICAVCVVPWSN